MFRSLIAGAAATGAHVIVSAGASFDALADLRTSSVHIHRRAPQVPLLQRIDAVITHGGNNTVQECLAAGRPMVVIPFGGDQRANAHRVERLAVGVRRGAADLPADAVRAAVEALSVPSVVERARHLARSKGTAACARRPMRCSRCRDGLVTRVVADGAELAPPRHHAAFPQGTLRSARRSVYEPWDFDAEGAVAHEIALGLRTIETGGTPRGSQRCAHWVGRHGTFDFAPRASVRRKFNVGRSSRGASA